MPNSPAGRLVDIVHEGFDLAVRVGSLADSTLAARTPGELDYGLFAAPHYLARRGLPGHPGDLQAHDTLAFAGGSYPADWTLSKGGLQEWVALQPRMIANNVFAVRDAAVTGLGVAQCP